MSIVQKMSIPSSDPIMAFLGSFGIINAFVATGDSWGHPRQFTIKFQFYLLRPKLHNCGRGIKKCWPWKFLMIPSNLTKISRIFFVRDSIFLSFSLMDKWDNWICTKWDACLPLEKVKVYVYDLAFLRSFHPIFLNFNKNLLTKIYLKLEFSLEFVGVKFKTVISLSSRKSFGDRKAKAWSSINKSVSSSNKYLQSQDQVKKKLTLFQKSTCRPSIRDLKKF